MNRFSAFAVTLLIGAHTSFAQGLSSRPQKWAQGTPLSIGTGISQLALSHNSPEQICKEILNTNLVSLIGKSGGLSDDDLKTIQIVHDSDGNTVWLYQIGNSEKAFNILNARLRTYSEARGAGHTELFLLAAITNHVEPHLIPDPDLRVLAISNPLLPVSWLRKSDSGTRTNRAGQIAGTSSVTTFVNGKVQTTTSTNLPTVDEVCRWVTYVATDGEIAWRYVLNFRVDGKLDFIDESKCDAKEYDPSYRKTIEKVNQEVELEMKRNGSFGKLGSVHTFWQLKREKLGAKGIEWRSPAELNPNTIYD
jgi:hypothetical protein